MSHKVYQMLFARIYPMLVAKVERKGRTKAEVDTVIQWLTGYTPEQIDAAAVSDISYQQFFNAAPAMNPLRHNITGSICGVKLQEITDPLMQDIRYLDKLVDELAKGKPLEKVLRG